MRKFHTKALLLLLFAMTANTLACSSGGSDSAATTDDQSSTDTTTANDETVSALEARQSIPDNLPDKDFDGRTFTVVTYSSRVPELYAESLNGEVVNDAIYNTRTAVNERFNVNIEVLSQDDYIATGDFIQRTVLANEEAFQLAAQHIINLGGMVVQDLFLNWYDIPNIDFSQPWWSKSTTEDLTYGKDKSMIAVGDFSLSSLSLTNCFFFDKVDAVTYGIENMYDVVWDGKWTLDYLMNVSKDVYNDLNGNAIADGDDYYGMSQSLQGALNTYLWSCGGKVMQKNSQGLPELVFHSEKTNAIVEKVYKIAYESSGICNQRESKYPGETFNFGMLAFRDGLSLFCSGTVDATGNRFRDKQHEYGILPYPKFDEAQEEYYTMTSGSMAAFAVPKTVSDTEFVGIITEALNAESYKSVFPAYYEVALKTKYTHDDESVNMLDYIIEHRVFDFGYVYDNFKGFSFYFQNLIGSEASSDFESYYAANSAASIAQYQSVLDYYASLD